MEEEKDLPLSFVAEVLELLPGLLTSPLWPRPSEVLAPDRVTSCRRPELVLLPGSRPPRPSSFSWIFINFLKEAAASPQQPPGIPPEGRGGAGVERGGWKGRGGEGGGRESEGEERERGGMRGRGGTREGGISPLVGPF